MTDIFDRREYTRQFILNGKGLRRLADSSMDTYLYQLNRFFNFCEFQLLDPDEFSEEGVKEYCAQSRTINELKGSIAALKLFFEFVLHKPLMFRYIPFSQPERKLPDILSQEEIVMIMEQITNPKHLFIFILMYSTGLRVGEVQELKEADFLFFRDQIKVRSAKGNKDRYVVFDETLKSLFHDYKKWREGEIKKFHFIPEYFFVGQFGGMYSQGSINSWLKKYAKQAGIEKKMHAHLMRHTYGTHMREEMVDLNTIGQLLGHAPGSKSTFLYAQLSNTVMKQAGTPMARIKHKVHFQKRSA